MCCVVRAVLLMAMGSFLATAVRADDVRRPVEPGDDLAKLAAEAPPGEEAAKMVADIYKAPPDVVAQAKDITGD